MKKKLYPLLSLLILLAGWQVFALAMQQPEWFPPVPRLLAATGRLLLAASFYEAVAATVLRGLAGLFLSLVMAAVLAGLLAKSEWLDGVFRPLLALMRSIPVISFILFALILLQPEEIPLLIAFLTMFPLLTENLANGLGQLRPGLAAMGRQFGVRRRNRLLHLIYPQLKPYLYSGLASAAGFGWRAVIMGEVLSQSAGGIGGEMKKAQNFMSVPELLAWTIIAVGLSYLFDKGITWLSRRNAPLYFARRSQEPDIGLPSPIQACNLGYLYGIRHFSHTFLPGRSYGISAPSGTGKTTLLNLLGGTLTPKEGKLTIDRTGGIACVFQEPELVSHLTALENIELVISRFYTPKEAEQRALFFLRMVEMEPYAGRLPGALSYGQQQRVALARALAFPARLLLMDEPFKGLDAALAGRIIRRIRQLQQERRQTLIFTSHHRDELRLLGDECMELPSGTRD